MTMIWQAPQQQNGNDRSQTRKAAGQATVLVLDADSRAGLACVQSLGAAGAKVHAGLRKTGALTERSRWCHASHLQPSYEPAEQALAWLLELDVAYAYALVVPATEGSLRWLRMLPESHPLRQKALIASNASIDIALDKDRTCELARTLGINIPFSRRIDQGDTPPLVLGFPCVLKPLRSKVIVADRLETIAVVVARDAKTRDATYSAWLPYTGVQEQEWVPGRGVGVEVLYRNGEPLLEFIHERLHEYPLQGGASTLRRAAPPDPELLELTHRLLRSLRWHGVAMVEWRRAPDGRLCLMEINPRLWGSLPLTLVAGVNMPVAMFEMAMGGVPKPERSWKVGMRARNATEDLRWLAADLRADRSDPLLLTEPPLRAALGWLSVFSGRERWDGWRLDDPAVAGTETTALMRMLAKAVVSRLLRRFQAARLSLHHRAVIDGIRRREAPVRRVLFLCYGNICRSPFAEMLATSRLPGVEVESTGFHPKSGRSSPPHLVVAAREFGVDLAQWRSQVLTPEHVDRAELILAMDLENLGRFKQQFPHALARTTLLGLFSPSNRLEIPDPYNLNYEQTRQVLQELSKAIDGLIHSDVLVSAAFVSR